MISREKNLNISYAQGLNKFHVEKYSIFVRKLKRTHIFVQVSKYINYGAIKTLAVLKIYVSYDRNETASNGDVKIISENLQVRVNNFFKVFNEFFLRGIKKFLTLPAYAAEASAPNSRRVY